MDRVIKTVRGVEGDVAIFGHGHSLRVLAARWLGLPPNAGRLFALGTATISVLGYQDENPAILRWNEHSITVNQESPEDDTVDQASEDSFPASDAPPWRP